MNEIVKHLTEKQLLGYANDSLDLIQSNEAGRHLLQCEQCRNLLPATSPEQFLSALFNEPTHQEKFDQQESFSFQSRLPVIFSPFHNVGRLAWSSTGLILVTGMSFLIWKATTSPSNFPAEFSHSDSTETNLTSVPPNTTPSDKQPLNSTVGEVAQSRSAENWKSNKSTSGKSSRQSLPVTELPEKINKIEEIEIVRLIEKTPATVISLRAENETVLRKTSDIAANKNTFALVSPVGQTVIETSPNFHWEKAPEADSYKVTIFDENFDEVLTANVSGNQFRPDQSLESGKKYLWRVAAQTRNGEIIAPAPPQPPAMFLIAEPATEDRIKSLKKKKDDQFKLAVFYAREGMFDYARCALLRILTINPMHRAAKRLLIKVGQWQKETKSVVQRCGIENSSD